MCVAEAMPCGCRTRRDARRQDLLRVARRRRAPAHARATSAMPAVKSRRPHTLNPGTCGNITFPIGALTRASTVQFRSDVSAKWRTAVPGARMFLREND